MSAPPFMSLYIADYLGDTRHLTTEQHGAYLLLLMSMWRAEGKLPNDRAKLARITGLSSVKWARIEGDVLEFFAVENGELTHIRIQKELDKAHEISQKRSRSGRSGGNAKALKNNETGLASAIDLPPHLPTHARGYHISQPHKTSEAIASSVGDTASNEPIERPPKAKRGTRLAEDWELDEHDWTIARKEGLTDDEIRETAREFRNYWCARAGRDATKISWPLTWANRAHEIGKRKREREGRVVAFSPRGSGPRHGGDVSFADLFLQRFGDGAEGG